MLLRYCYNVARFRTSRHIVRSTFETVAIGVPLNGVSNDFIIFYSAYHKETDRFVFTFFFFNFNFFLLSNENNYNSQTPSHRRHDFSTHEVYIIPHIIIRGTAVVIIYRFVSGHVTAPSRIILLLLAGKRAYTHIIYTISYTHTHTKIHYCDATASVAAERLVYHPCVRISEKYIIFFTHTLYYNAYYNAYTCVCV